MEPGRSRHRARDRARDRPRDRTSEAVPVSYLVANPTPVIAANYSENLPQSSYEPDPPIHRPGLYSEASNIEAAAYVETVEVEDRARRTSCPQPDRRPTDQEEYDTRPQVYVVEERRATGDTRYASRSRSRSRSRDRSRSKSPSVVRIRMRPGRGAELEDMDAYEDFDFEFPSAEPFKNGDTSDFETPSLDASTAALDEKPAIQGSNATGIYSSRYNGTAELGAHHEALLTALHIPKGLGKPLFIWL